MFGLEGYFQNLITESSTAILSLACFAGAVAAFIYVPVVGRWIAAVLVAVGFSVISYDLGYISRGAQDNSSELSAQLDEAQRELSATKTITEEFTARQTAAEIAHQRDQEKIDVYTEKLRTAAANGGCLPSDDDVRSLRDIGDTVSPSPPRLPSQLRKSGSSPASK